MAIEDKELFVESIKDIMIPAFSAVGFLLLTIVLCTLWMPFLLIMGVIGGGLVISFVTYKDRLAQKKRDEERNRRYR